MDEEEYVVHRLRRIRDSRWFVFLAGMVTGFGAAAFSYAFWRLMR
jgi:hypothetical protein